jgi:hypothetical protein
VTGRAPHVAAYLVERQGDDIEPAELWVEIRECWPDLTVEQGSKSSQIAAEILASIAENEAVCAAREAEMIERHLIAGMVADCGGGSFIRPPLHSKPSPIGGQQKRSIPHR